MDLILSFFSDLILFTFGLAVLIFWIGIVVVVAIEIWDAFHENEEDADAEADLR